MIALPLKDRLRFARTELCLEALAEIERLEKLLDAPSPTVTRDGIEVRVGQIWKDLDKRMVNRHLRVQEIANGRAICLRCREDGTVLGEQLTRIAIARMHKSTTGFALVRDMPRN